MPQQLINDSICPNNQNPLQTQTSSRMKAELPLRTLDKDEMLHLNEFFIFNFFFFKPSLIHNKQAQQTCQDATAPKSD